MCLNHWVLKNLFLDYTNLEGEVIKIELSAILHSISQCKSCP